jgi:hypothetical protein
MFSGGGYAHFRTLETVREMHEAKIEVCILE